MSWSLAMILVVVGVILVAVGILQHFVLKLNVLHLTSIVGGIGLVVLLIGVVGSVAGKRAA